MGRERDGERVQGRADAHQCDQAPSADEESRNTLEVTGGRGGMVNSTQARPRARCMQSITDAKFPVGDTSDGVRGGSSMNSRPKEELERT